MGQSTNYLPYGNNEHKAFVGALPYGLSRKALEAQVKRWGDVGVVMGGLYYQSEQAGWCTIEFSSRRRRDEFVRNKSRFNQCFNKVVDIKEYVQVPKQLKEAARHPSKKAQDDSNRRPSPPSGGAGPSNGAAARPAPVAPWAAANSAPPVQQYFVRVPSASPASALSGVVDRYFYGGIGHMGVIKEFSPDRQKSRETIFHVAVVYYCSVHRLHCTSANCRNIGKLDFQPGLKLSDLFPPKTNVHFTSRSLQNYADNPDMPFKRQAEAVWSATSARPAIVKTFDPDELDLHLIDFISSPFHDRMPPLSASQVQSHHNHAQPAAPNALAHLNAGNVAFGPVGNFSSEIPAHLRFQDPTAPEGAAAAANVARPGSSAATSEAAESRNSGASSNNLHLPDNDVDTYLFALQQLKQFLEGEMRDAGFVDSPTVLPLARKIIKDMSSNLDKPFNHIASSGALKISQFLNNNGMRASGDDAEAQKKASQRMLTNYKVYCHQLKHQLGQIRDVTAAAKAGLAKLAAASDKSASSAQSGEFKPVAKAAPSRAKAPVVAQVNTDGDVNSSRSSSGTKDEGSSSETYESVSGFQLTLDRMVVNLNPIKSFLDEDHDGKTLLKRSISSPAKDVEKSGYNLTLAPLKVWLQKFTEADYNECQELLPSAVVFTWTEADKSHASLLSSFQELLYKPARLLGQWATLAENVWKDKHGQGCRFAISTVPSSTYQHCLEHLFPNMVNSSLASLLMGVEYRSDSGNAYNVKGIIVHLFNDHFCLVQTTRGIALLERHRLYVHVSNKWTQSKKLLVGTFVKMHLAIGKVKTKRHKTDFFYATKAWINNSCAREPNLDPLVPGGKMYWKEVMEQFEEIVRSNPTLAIGGDDSTIAEYNSAVSHFLQLRLDGRSSGGGREPDDGADAAVVDEFGDFLERKSEAHGRVDLVGALKVLRRSGLTAERLRQCHAAAAFFDAGGGFALFAEAVERALLEAPMAHFSRRCRRAVNLAPILAAYFALEDARAKEMNARVAAVAEKPPSFSPALVAILSAELSSAEEKVEPQGKENAHKAEPEPSPVESPARNNPEVEDKAAEALNVTASSKDSSVYHSFRDDDDDEDGEEDAEDDTDTGDGASSSGRSQLEEEMDALGRAIGALATKMRAVDERVGHMEEFQAEIDPIVQEDIRKLKNAARSGKTSAAPLPPIKRWSSNKKVVVIRSPDNGGQRYEIPTRDDGNLTYQAVKAVFPGVNALKYSPQQSGDCVGSSTRICNRLGDIFEAPEDGWGERTYLAHVPPPPPPPPRPAAPTPHQQQQAAAAAMVNAQMAAIPPEVLNAFMQHYQLQQRQQIRQ